jgi:hypothetical protein
MKIRIVKNNIDELYKFYGDDKLLKIISKDEAVDIFYNSYSYYLNISSDNAVLRGIIKPTKIMQVMQKNNRITDFRLSENVLIEYTEDIYDDYEECVKSFNTKLELFDKVIQNTYNQSIKRITENFAKNMEIIKESKINIRATKLNNILGI